MARNRNNYKYWEDGRFFIKIAVSVDQTEPLFLSLSVIVVVKSFCKFMRLFYKSIYLKFTEKNTELNFAL